MPGARAAWLLPSLLIALCCALCAASTRAQYASRPYVCPELVHRGSEAEAACTCTISQRLQQHEEEGRSQDAYANQVCSGTYTLCIHQRDLTCRNAQVNKVVVQRLCVSVLHAACSQLSLPSEICHRHCLSTTSTSPDPVRAAQLLGPCRLLLRTS